MGTNAHFFRFEMDIQDLSATVEKLLRPVIEDQGYELVDLQLRSEAGRWVLRLLVDRPGGITLDECARVSREVGPHLDVADLLHFRYALEVSSPGIKRPLKRSEDFLRFSGQRVEVFTVVSVGGRKVFRGLARGVDAEGNVLVEETEGRLTSIPLGTLRRANLDPELKF